MTVFISKEDAKPGSFIYRQHISSFGGYNTMQLTNTGTIALHYEDEWTIVPGFNGSHGEVLLRVVQRHFALIDTSRVLREGLHGYIKSQTRTVRDRGCPGQMAAPKKPIDAFTSAPAGAGERVDWFLPSARTSAGSVASVSVGCDGSTSPLFWGVVFLFFSRSSIDFKTAGAIMLQRPQPQPPRPSGRICSCALIIERVFIVFPRVVLLGGGGVGGTARGASSVRELEATAATHAA